MHSNVLYFFQYCYKALFTQDKYSAVALRLGFVITVIFLQNLLLCSLLLSIMFQITVHTIRLLGALFWTSTLFELQTLTEVFLLRWYSQQ